MKVSLTTRSLRPAGLSGPSIAPPGTTGVPDSQTLEDRFDSSSGGRGPTAWFTAGRASRAGSLDRQA